MGVGKETMYIKVMRVLQGDVPADRMNLDDFVFHCSDDDHQFHLFKEMVASLDNDPDWAAERSDDGFREWRNKTYPALFCAVFCGYDDNPHWEPGFEVETS